MAFPENLLAHLQGGATQLCRCWSVERRDGVVLGFTDHDRDLEFGGIRFRADTGVSASSMEQSSGLAVDNAEVLGVLNASAITRADLDAGRYDGAVVRMWLVNWADVTLRALRFKGSIGEVRVDGQAFRAELRGLSETLNRPMGRAYQKTCAARLGDRACGVDISRPEYSAETVVSAVVSPGTLRLEGLGGYAANWFERATLRLLDGAGVGLGGAIKHDKRGNGFREIVLWEELRAPMVVGQRVSVVAGCDKLAETCSAKFANIVNFRGFPFLPGEDWLMAYPRGGSARTAAE